MVATYFAGKCCPTHSHTCTRTAGSGHEFNHDYTSCLAGHYSAGPKTSLVPKRFHVFQCIYMRKNLEGLVNLVMCNRMQFEAWLCIYAHTMSMVIDVTNCVGEWAEIRNSSLVQLHHQINQAFPIFLTNLLKKHGKAWVRG